MKGDKKKEISDIFRSVFASILSMILYSFFSQHYSLKFNCGENCIFFGWKMVKIWEKRRTRERESV